jgi:hypothetical protein
MPAARSRSAGRAENQSSGSRPRHAADCRQSNVEDAGPRPHRCLGVAGGPELFVGAGITVLGSMAGLHRAWSHG